MKRALKPEMKFGAEPKKLAVLGGLLFVAALVWLINRSDSPQSSSPPTTPAASSSTPSAPAPETASSKATQKTARSTPSRGSAGSNVRGRGPGGVQEFHPTLKPKDPIDTSKVDPRLRKDLLAKLQTVKSDGPHRSLFDFGAAPAPMVEVPKVKPIVIARAFTGPRQPPPPAPPPPKQPPPPPPPIPLKFYGYANTRKVGPKKAFFVEGEEIHIAGEGEMIKNRYKVVRIGVNSADVEDTSNKNKQTLPLVEEFQSS